MLRVRFIRFGWLRHFTQKEFYERFYNYKLSESELKEILHPSGEF